MHAAVVVPADEFCEYTSKMPFIPDQHSVETLPAKCPYQPLDVRRRIGRTIWLCLANTPAALRILTFWSRGGTLGGYD